MKRIILILAIIIVNLFSFKSLHAQAGIGLPFGFGITQPSQFITAPNLINMALLYSGTPAKMDELDTLINFGGSVIFEGIAYDRVCISTNGWLALIPSSAGLPASFPLPSNPVNLLNNNTTGFPIIAPLWDDMSMLAIQWNWTAPVLSVRWAGRWNKTNASQSNSFGVKIDGVSGVVTFFYGNLPYTPSSPSASIGIAGTCSGDFTSVNVLSATTAVSDSVIEHNVTTRPNNVNYIFTPYNPHNNCSGTYIAKDLGTISTTCDLSAAGNFSTVHATTSGSGMACAAGEVNDVWFSVIKPAGVTNVKVTTGPGTCQPLTGTTVEVRASCAGASLGCSTTGTTYPTFGEVNVTRPCAAETLYVRVTGDGDAEGKFQICVQDNGVGISGGATCTSAVNICALPYSRSGLTTAGFGNDYNSVNTVCHSSYASGEDYIFAYTPTVSQCIRVSVTSTGTNPAVFIYNNCPDSSTIGNPTYCLGSAEGVSGTVTINSVTLIAGTTYYIMVDNQNVGGNIPFDISINSLGTTNTYDNCATPFNLGSVVIGQTCSFQTFSTECSTPSAAGTVPVPSCISSNVMPRKFIDGVTGDVWFSFVAGYTGALQISTQQGSVNPTANAAMSVYTGSCGALIQNACDYNSGPNGMPVLFINVNNGTTYYIRVWSENPESQGSFDLCLQSACAPSNDLPCSAQFVQLGSVVSGNNTCASSVAEPLNAAQCVAGGVVNTVWYKTIVPSTGAVRVRTQLLGYMDTQIQAYTFSQGCSNAATNFTSQGCNNDGTKCGAGGGFIQYSELSFVGLPVGDTLFVAVDGVVSLTGSFEISFIEGQSGSFVPTSQDCAGAKEICTNADIFVAEPGLRNFGNICDFPSGIACFGVPERNSQWYKFTVDPALSSGTATLNFDVITPSTTDMDFAIWDITSAQDPCALISSGQAADRCNVSGASYATGLSNIMSLPSYSNAITLSGTPRTYMLFLMTYSSTINDGYILDWRGTPISNSSSTSGVRWTGITDTLFTNSSNWGDCGATPTCGIDANINPTSNLRQPTITVNSSVKNITISAGASLRIKAGITLSVCGNFTNNGTLICEPGSTIQFQQGSTLQTISGNLTGANAFANLVINKSAGSVILNSNIDVSGDFTTASNTSQFNINKKHLKVGGNFTNANGTGTFLITNLGNSRVEFNGTANQNLTNIAGTFNLNRMIVNKPAGKLYLIGANSSINIDTTLTLTSGVINTRNVAANFIYLKWISADAVTGYNVNSYVDGKLRRQIYNFGYTARGMLLDWPVGDSATGYQLANILFDVAGTNPGIPYLTGSFDSWTGNPPLGPFADDCSGANYNLNPLLNHGYWTFSRSTGSFNGKYTLKMKSSGFTNDAGTDYTIVKADIGANPNLESSWSLIGQCMPASTQYTTERTNINGTTTYTVSTTAGSNILSTASTESFYVGLSISGTGIPSGSVVSTIVDGTTFLISNAATATGTIISTIGSPASTATFFNHLYAIGVGIDINELQASAVQLLPILCNGGQAKIEVTASGGTAPYVGEGEFFVNAGTNIFTVVDSNGDSATTTFIVSEPAVLTANTTATPLCNNLFSDIVVTAVGGTPPYIGTGTYSVGAGTYSYIVTDFNNCSDTTEVSISQPSSQVSISVNATPILVYGGVSNVSVSASGGTPPYSGTGIFNEQAGNYTYTVLDSNGCSAQTTILISEPDQLIVTATKTNTILCFGDTANILISASGGVAPYSGTGIFSVTAGVFNYTVTDFNGSSVSQTFTIVQPQQLQVTATAGTISCFGGNSAINVSATGGTEPYSGVGNFNVSAGVYTYIVNDFNNCTSSTSVSVDQPAKVEGTIATTSAGCSGNSGTATVAATGGTGTFSYLWSDGQTTSVASGLVAGSYTVTITDANNCTGSVTATVTGSGSFPASPGSITGPSSLCRNLTGIVFSISPVVGATSYQWTLPNGISGSSTSTSITVSTSSTYAGGFICVAAVNNCGAGPTSCMNVPVITTYPSRPNILNGPSITCGPGIYTYSTSANNASSFTWKVTGSGVTILSGQGTNTIQLSVPAGFSQGSVQVYSSNCYGNSATRGTTLTGIPLHSNSVTGPMFVCANNSAVYTMPLVPGVASSDYVWSVTGDAMVASSSVGTLSSTATINFGPSWTTGVVTINVFNICGTYSRSFTVRSTPPQPGSMSGPNTGLCNLSSIAYSIGAVTTATSYTWTVPPGVTIVSTSPNGQSIVVDFTSAFTSNSANICVTANSACGSSASRCYTVTSRTVAPTISGPTSVCKTQSNVAYSVTPLSGATSYTWTVSDNATITPSVATANVDFNTSTAGSVIVRSTALNSCGVSPIGLLGVGVNVLCREKSEVASVVSEMTFFPNPVSHSGILSVYSHVEQNCKIEIKDILGNTLFTNEIKTVKGENNYELSFVGYAKGTYFVCIKEHNENLKAKVVIVE
jgi:hypothetical protein